MPRALLAVIIAVVTLVAAAGYHRANVTALREAQPKLLYGNGTIKTPDDNAYLAPPLNFYSRGQWREWHPGAAAWFLRTPGYGIFRWLLLCFFGTENAGEYVFLMQLLLFSLAAAALFGIGLNIGLKRNEAIGLAVVYGATPVACSFLNYNLTESITPQLVIFITCFLFLWKEKKRWYYLAIALGLLAFLILTRPVLVFMMWPAAVFCMKQFAEFKVLKTAAALGLVLLPIFAWEVRNTIIAGKYPGLHPIYFETSNSMYRSSHRELWNFEKTFGKDVTAFHAETGAMWKGAVADSNFLFAKQMAAGCLPWVGTAVGDSDLLQAFVLYEKSVVIQQLQYPAGMLLPDTIPGYEVITASMFSLLRDKLIQKEWWRCEVGVPLLNLKRMTVHSNLSLYVFQHTWRGNFWIECLRWLFALLHVCVFAALLPVLFFAERMGKPALLLRPFAAAAVFYVLYLAFVFRALEERYTLPFFVIGLLCLFALIHRFRNKIQAKSW